MADEEKKPDEQSDDGAGKSKKKLVIFGGGGAALVATAFVVAMLAVPKKPAVHELLGPFVAPVFTEDLRVNLSGESNKRFAVLALNVIYEAYDQKYYDKRVLDTLYQAELKDAVIGIASTKQREELVGAAYKPVFLEEVRQEVEPLLFPVYVGLSKQGDAAPPTDSDKRSGLALGESQTTFRGRYWDHVLKVDAPAKTVQLDGEEPVSFEGDETDLELVAPSSETIYLDVTGLAPEFLGELQVGVKGRIRKMLWEDRLIQ